MQDYQDQAFTMPIYVEENQFASPSPSPSAQNLTTWEKIIHQRIGDARDSTKENECGEKEPVKPKAHNQLREKEASRQKSSMYRGVTKDAETRFEAYVWDNTRPGRGKSVYIGVFKNAIEAARAHDLVAIKMWGNSTYTNFPVNCYLKEISEMKSKTVREWILYVRKASKNKKKSNYLGVSRIAKSEKWQARLDRGNGMPDLFLGTFDTEEDAAKAYDIASIRSMGKEAFTNFGLRSYDNVDTAMSTMLPVEEAIVSSSLEKQTVDDALYQRRDNEACHPYAKLNEHESGNSCNENINHHIQILHQDVITSSPYVLDGLTSTELEVGVESNVACDYEAIYPNQGYAIEQSMFLLGTGQESQAPQPLLNQSTDVNESHEKLFDNTQCPNILLQDYQHHSFQNNLMSFQNDLTFLNWPHDFGTPVEGSTEMLYNDLNGESSMHNMVKQNPGGEPYQHGYEPYQHGLNQDMDQNISSRFTNDFQNHCSEINTSIHGGMAEIQTDLDISDYLDTYMEETDWSNFINELLAPSEANINSTMDLGFKEDGTQP